MATTRPLPPAKASGRDSEVSRSKDRGWRFPGRRSRFTRSAYIARVTIEQPPAVDDAPLPGALSSTKAPRRKVVAWAFWDWGTQPFATVITTFVFSVYLTSSAFGDKDEVTIKLAWATGTAGLLIALLAPVLGQGADRTGKRMFHLRWQTWLLAAICAAMYFVAPAPEYFLLGAVLLGAGNVVSESIKCRCRHLMVYADVWIMPTVTTSALVGTGWVGGLSA